MTANEPATSGPADGYVTGGGGRLHYLEWRPPADREEPPTAVFLHGGGLNAHTWRRTIESLAGDIRCIALDLRGHGDSDWHPDADYALESHAADVGATVEQLGLDWPVIVGMSLGGAVALTYAGGRPASLRGLVMIDSGPGGSREEGRRRLGDLMEGHQEYPSLDAAADRALAVNPDRDREQLRRSVARNMRETTQGTWTWKWDPRIRWRSAPMSADEEKAIADERSRRLWAAAAAVTCPTLVIRGGESDMFLEADARRTVAGIPNARLVTIPGAGHTVQADRPDELARQVREFITRDTAAEPSAGS
jgi:pimeloyl-ACP methyl ester carboxylesterase